MTDQSVKERITTSQGLVKKNIRREITQNLLDKVRELSFIQRFLPDEVFSMKIPIGQIPEEGKACSFVKGDNWLQELLDGSEPVEFSVSDVHVACVLRKVREAVYVEGSLATEVRGECCRCLENARLRIQCEFRYIFLPEPDIHAEETELSRDDLDCVYYREEVIDLDPVIYEQIMLQVPMKMLCRDDCRGLCSSCGANLNREACTCPPREGDERLAVLKKLKLKNS